MFHSESAFQALVHDQPGILLSGVPDIDPDRCPDTPSLISLGREVSLASGPIDNLFIDINGILTFVECKRYGDYRLKREVYAQALNYAADLRNALFHYKGADFIREFFALVSKASAFPYRDFDALIADLAKDSLLENKRTSDWECQFVERLESNIRGSVCRIIIACAPSPENSFAHSEIRNLMDILGFTETSRKPYDLILMDVRSQADQYIARMIWRNHNPLPQIPLVAQSRRNKIAGIERMRKRLDKLPADSRKQLNALVAILQDTGLETRENSYGLAIYPIDSSKSTFTTINIKAGHWTVQRMEIRPWEPELFKKAGTGQFDTNPEGAKVAVTEKIGALGTMYEAVVTPTPAADLHAIAGLIHELKYIDNPRLRQQMGGW